MNDKSSKDVSKAGESALAGRPSSRTDVDAFLAAVRSVPAPRPAAGTGRLAFALDATASRQPTWDLAREIQAEMFSAAAAFGGLEIQIVYYRGMGECRASPFVSQASQLQSLMRQIACAGGLTQIERILKHLVREADRSGLRCAVFVGDALEEPPEILLAQAGQLALRGVRLFVFQEGDDPRVEKTFRELARTTSGAYCRFAAGAGAELKALLRAVAAYAAGGHVALLNTREAGAQRLLTALEKGGPA